MSKLRSSTLPCASWMLLRHPRVLDGLVVRHAHALHERLDLVAREDAHQVVLERQVEAARARVALAARAAAELVVDAARLVPLGAEDVQAAELADLVALGLAGRRRASRRSRRTPRAPCPGRGPARLNSSFAIISGLPPRRMSVPRPAMFVLTVMAPLRPAWATTNASRSWCLALRTACGILLLLEQVRDRVALLDAGRADEDRLALLVALEQLGHDGGELLALGLVDDVLVVLADHRLVRRDRR